IAAFIIPYMFILQPELLMIDTTFWEVILILATAIAGMIAIGGGLIGFWYRKLHWAERIVSVSTGLLLIYPDGYRAIAGTFVFFVMIGLQLQTNKKKKVVDQEIRKAQG